MIGVLASPTEGLLVHAPLLQGQGLIGQGSGDSLRMVYDVIGNSSYGVLAALALFGLYEIIIIWTRVQSKRFKTELQQDEFMDQLDPLLRVGEFDSAAEFCEGDKRIVPQLVILACEHRELGYKKLRPFLLERFRRDFMTDLEYRLSWVATVVKSAPMVGLFGTVFGMMGVFRTLATAESVQPSQLAGDINVALITTALGLTIAIPLIILVAAVNIRIAKMEDLVGAGLNRMFEALKQSPIGTDQ
jgi:biopolymer transport protein ExbB